MKKLSMFMGKLALLMLGVCFFAACSDDDSPSYSTASVQNTELLSVLKDAKYGLTFNENGNLLLDDAAKNTTKLDLSGTKISQSALSELTILPNLTEVDLSNNGYGPVFHVDSLPTQITGLDLRGNDVYDFEGLVDASNYATDATATILHSFTKLYLPATSKYNVEDLVPFYAQNQNEAKAIDMQMVGDNGTLQAYNTLREIPDTYFRTYLQRVFPSMFDGNGNLDISNIPTNLSEIGANIQLQYSTDYEDYAKIVSLEGLEYFVNNPYLQPFYVYFSTRTDTKYSVSRLMPRENIIGLIIDNIDTPNGLDLSKATHLSTLSFANNHSLISLDLTNTAFLNQDVKDFYASSLMFNGLTCKDCENLEEIILSNSNYAITQKIVLLNLPKLKAIDLHKLEGFETLALCKLPSCEITYPSNLKYSYSSGSNETYTISSDNSVCFAISQDVLDMESTKSFIEKYDDYLYNDRRSYKQYGTVRW